MTSGAVAGERLTGTVRGWLGNFGFIEVPKNRSWFFAHPSDLIDVEQLTLGQRVSFIPTPTEKGPRALCIEVLAPAPERR